VRDGAGPSIEDHEPRLAARERGLRDQLIRKQEIEVRDFHDTPAFILQFTVQIVMKRYRAPFGRRSTDIPVTTEDAGIQPAPPAPSGQIEDTTPAVAIRMPVGVRSIAITTLAVIAGIWFLQYAQSVLIPFVLGILIAYALEPFVGGLERVRLPRAIGAAVVLVAVTGGIAFGAYSLRGEAMDIVTQIPEAAQRMRTRLQRHHQDRDGALQKVERAANELQETANAATTQPTPPPAATRGIQRVQVVQPAFNASNYLYWGSMGIVGALSQAALILFLVYFFLSTGDLYKRKLVKIAGPHLWQKKLTVQILDDINRQIASFIRVQILTSVIVAAATMAALWYFGLDQWVIWGLAAGIFNSIPYLGPVIVTGGLGTVAFLQFDDIGRTLMVCGVALVITSLEGFLLTPALMSRAAQMNAVAVFVGLLFWSWIWGVWGAVLAVPMLMMLKAVCDHIDDLQPIGELLGD
jgi:predicted PurR-regulated permease PerM